MADPTIFILPAPGTPGHCDDVECSHEECATVRESAGLPCRLCGEPMGYGVPVQLRLAAGGAFLSTHVACVEAIARNLIE